MDIRKRIKSPIFWITLGGLFFSATGIDPTQMKSWSVLFDAIVRVASNPFLAFSFILAVVGHFRNPVTKGFKD